jgi:UDP-N-acetylmuramate dehydrogenase
MMAAERIRAALIERLPEVRGRYSENAPLERITWFRVGGPAEIMFRPADAEDLATFLAGRPADVPVTVIGVGSNLLVRDGGVPGVVIRLGAAFAAIRASREADRALVAAGAAALDLNVALAAAEAGIAGLEFLSGIPGTIGGALRMNGGAFGSDMAAVVRSAEALDGEGRRHVLDPAALGFAYRHSSVPEDFIFLGATLEGRPGERAAITARMAEIRDERAASQPLRARTGGSTFTNPGDPRAQGRRAWELIDAAGCRGLRRGGAAVSEKHCNFLINTGTASAADLEALGEEVRRRVYETSGVLLEWEIRRIGVPLPATRLEIGTGAAP